MRLFLSYSHKDMERVKALQEALKTMGHSAVRDEDFMRANAKWRDQIENIIRRHDAVVYAISPDAVRSAEVRDEIEKANKYRKPILHVKIAPFDDPNNPMPDALEQFHILDAIDGMTEQVKEFLQRDLMRIARDRTMRHVLQSVAALVIVVLIGILGLFAARNALPVAMQATLGMLTFTPTPTDTTTATNTPTVTFTPTNTPTVTPTILPTADVSQREVRLVLTDLDKRAECPTALEATTETKIELAVESVREQYKVNVSYSRVRRAITSKEEAQQLAKQTQATIVIWGLCNGNVFLKLNYTLVPQWSEVKSQPTESQFLASASAVSALDQLSSTIINSKEIDYVLNFVIAQLAYSSDEFETSLDVLNTTIGFGEELANNDFQQAKRLQLDSAYFTRGYILQASQHKLNEAISDYTQALQFNPALDKAYNNRGVAKHEFGDKQGALQDFTQAIQLNPDNVDGYNNRGGVKSDLGDKQGALQDFNHAIQLDPNIAQCYFNRGLVRSDLGDKQGALQDYTQAIQLDPTYVKAYFNRGNINDDLGDKQGALQDYTQAIQLDPTYVKAYFNRGLIRSNLGDKQGALQNFDHAIQLDPNDATVYLNRGNVKYDLGDKQGALQDYTQAIQLDPTYTDGYFNRGNVKYNLGDKQGALQDYDHAIQLDPNDATVYLKRGNVKYDLGDEQGALQDYDHAIQLDPTYVKAYSDRGVAKYLSGDKQGGLQDLDRAIQLDPNYAITYYYRGLAYEGLREYELALADFRKFVELRPNDPNGPAQIAKVEAILTPQPTMAFFASPTFSPTRTPQPTTTP